VKVVIILLFEFLKNKDKYPRTILEYLVVDERSWIFQQRNLWKPKKTFALMEI
jgi:hypothetical protein